jgi:hypothetical protein
VFVVLEVDLDIRMLCLHCVYQLKMYKVVVYEHERAVIPYDDGSAITLDIEDSV